MFTVHVSGERIRHHLTVGPVAHHHASPHQENHTGRRERPPLTSPPCSSSSPQQQTCFPSFCLEPVTCILAAILTLWPLALIFLTDTVFPPYHLQYFFFLPFFNLLNPKLKHFGLYRYKHYFPECTLHIVCCCILLWYRYLPNSFNFHNWATIPNIHTSTLA